MIVEGYFTEYNAIVCSYKEVPMSKDRVDKVIRETIDKVADAAKSVWKDLGGGWEESVYQKAMEVALRERGVIFESQRILPVFYRDKNTHREYCVGEGKPDLVVWVETDEKKWTAIVIDLKADTKVKPEHERQVLKYMESLRKQLKNGESVHSQGMVINFAKPQDKEIRGRVIEKEPDIDIDIDIVEKESEEIQETSGEKKTREK